MDRFYKVDYRPNFLSAEEIIELEEECRVHFPLKLPRNKRMKRSFGVKGLSYTVVFRGTPVVYHLEDWDAFPMLKRLRDRIGNGDNYCVIQYYPHGGVGIKAHRDKAVSYTHLTLPTNREV